MNQPTDREMRAFLDELDELDQLYPGALVLVIGMVRDHKSGKVTRDAFSVEFHRRWERRFGPLDGDDQAIDAWRATKVAGSAQ